MSNEANLKLKLKTKNEKFEIAIPNLEGTDIAEHVSVTVPVYFDEEIKEWILTEEAEQIIDDTKARHMGLILPSQMKELRKRLGFSQVDMGKLFQTGEKSWARWESGKHRPTRSISLFVMAVNDGQIPLDYLFSKSKIKSGIAAVLSVGTTIKNNASDRKIIPFDCSYSKSPSKRYNSSYQDVALTG